VKKTHILSLAAASALASTAALATPSINFYGDLDASVNHTDVDSAPGSSIDMESFESKIGVTGGEDLGNGMRAFYRAEFGTDVTDEGDLGSGNHERYVGLMTSYGKVRIGTIASPHDDVVSVTDKFNNKHAVNRYSLVPNLRTNNTVRFDGGNEAGLSYSVAVTAGDLLGSIAPGGAIPGTADQEVDLWTGAVKYASANFTAGFSHSSFRGGDTGQSTVALNGLGLSLALDVADLALTYEIATQDHTSTDNIYLSGTMSLSEKTNLTAGYGIQSVDNGPEETSFTLGAHYGLGASTLAYAEYASVSEENTGVAAHDNDRWINVGVRHTFGDNGRTVVHAK
jgi:predicted porin